MKLRDTKPKYAYDDLLMVPSKSWVHSREECHIPDGTIFVSPMDSIVSPESAVSALEAGASVVIHRYQPLEDRIALARELDRRFGFGRVFVAIGVSEVPLLKLGESDRFSICIDVAHGDSQAVHDAVQAAREISLGILMAGNVATPEAALALAEAGADMIRLGIGSGSACSTRVMTGVGYPMASLIAETKELLDRVKPKAYPTIIADGGIRSPGDAAKALALGADGVMCGGYFAGCIYTPSAKTGVYRGMASHDAQTEWRGKVGNGLAEGVSVKVEACNQTVGDRVNELKAGIRSAMSYVGVTEIFDFQQSAEFVVVTNAGYIEGTPHAIDKHSK